MVLGGCIVTETNGEYIPLTPDFKKPAIGDAVKVEAVDWGDYSGKQMHITTTFTIVHGTIYGRVVACDDSQIVLAMQVFFDDTMRGVLAIPWVTIEQVTILERGGDA
jgi:hypothetical protein